MFRGSRITTLGRRALGDIRGSSARRVRCARPTKLTYRLVHATLKREHLVDVVRYVTHVAEEFKAGLALWAGGDPQRRVVRLACVWNRRSWIRQGVFRWWAVSRAASGVRGPLDAGRCGWARRLRWRPAPERPTKNSGTRQKVWICQTVDARATGRGFGFLCDGDIGEALLPLAPPCVCVLIPIVLWASSSGRGANGVGTYDQALSSAVGGVVDPFSRAPAVTGGSGQGQRDVVDGKPLVAVLYGPGQVAQPHQVLRQEPFSR